MMKYISYFKQQVKYFIVIRSNGLVSTSDLSQEAVSGVPLFWQLT